MMDQRPFGDELPPTFGAGAESVTPHEHNNPAAREGTAQREGNTDRESRARVRDADSAPRAADAGSDASDTGEEPSGDELVEGALPAEGDPRRRRRRRGGRGRRRGRDNAAAEGELPAGESSTAPVESGAEPAAEALPEQPVEPLPLSEDEGELPELGEYEEVREGAPSEDGERRGRRRRRGRRGGRGRRRAGAAPGEEGLVGGAEGAPLEGPEGAAPSADGERADELAPEGLPLDPALEEVPFLAAPAEPAEGEGGRRRGRRGRGRRGRGGRRSEGEGVAAVTDGTESESPSEQGSEAPAAEGGAPTPEGEGGEGGGRRRRRRGRGRGRGREGQTGPVGVELIPGEEDELPEPPKAEAEEAEPVASQGGRRERAEKPKEAREPKEEVRAPRPGKKNIILVNAVDREETRVAVIEDGRIVDFQMHVRRHETLVNDIYRGKVVNLEPAIGAAFIDFGEGRNGFLHTSDVLAAYGDKDWSLDKLLTHKIDPEEWDEKSSQPHVGVELSDAHPAAAAHERHDDHHGHGHDHDHDHTAEAGEHAHPEAHDHDHDHDHDEMVEVTALEAAAPSEHLISAPAEEPSMDFSFAVDSEEHEVAEGEEPAPEPELAPESEQPSGLEADASALVRAPGQPPAKQGGRNRRRDERGGKPGGGKQGGGNGRMRGRPRHPITELLQKGQSVVVQITKDAIGDKGPTLTTYISIPGRYLVLMPSMSRTGVSRKIEDEKERRRLKRILESLEIPAGMGVIVRTAGTGCTKEDLKRDLDYLMLLWDSFGKRLQLGRGPSPLYEESDVAIRTIRDLFNDHTEAVIVDDEKVYNRVREFMQKLIPEMVDRVQLHQGPKPLFHQHNVEQDFERIFSRRIDLPSGGSIVFDQAEALVAIDVNSGKTRSDGFDFEDVALRTNLDAVKEIARQIRLRDLGGIIVCDFIDMMRSGSRKKVENALRDAMATDRARSKLGRISQFGLLELTRQRLGPGLSKMLFHNCQRCRGSGRLRTVESRTGAILRRLGSALVLKGFTKVEVRTQPEVVDYMKRNYNQDLRDLMLKHEKEIELVSVGDQIDDSVLRYLRADGREVRPGGRRKR